MRRAALAGLVAVAACRGRGDARDTDGIDVDGSGGSADGADDDGGPIEGECADQLPARRVRRLSHAEYLATLRDLVGAAPEITLAADNVIDGYATDPDALTISGVLADQYREVAESVAEIVAQDPSPWSSCDVASEGEAACTEDLVRALGRELYRRPLADDEVARYTDLHAALVDEDGHEESLRWVVAAMLQSPGFLYRTELGEPADDGTYRLTSHEIAAALSYLVTGTMPDAELAQAADDDLLRDPEEIAAQAERLLATEAAQQTWREFAVAWLRVGTLEFVSRDMELFPAFTTEIRTAMRGEFERLAVQTYADSGTLAQLLQSETTFATPALAEFYGMPIGDGSPDAQGFVPTALPERDRGLFTRGAIVATQALPTTPSPIHRGLLVRERLLCQDMPPPPPGVANGAPDVDPDTTNRERYVMHSADPSCAGCHHLLDPIGFGFEHYDAVGRWRDEDGGQPVDAHGEIIGSTDADATFDGVQELAAILADSEVAQGCYARQWTQYSFGGWVNDDGLECVADTVANEVVAADGQLDAVVAALVAAPGFRARRADGADGGDDEGGDDDDDGSDPEPGTTSDSEPDDSSSGEPTPDDPALDVVVTVNTTWQGGECDDVVVTNVSQAAVTWSVPLPVDGTISTVWNATATVDGDVTVFTGVDFNGTIEPGASASFGFCFTTT